MSSSSSPRAVFTSSLKITPKSSRRGVAKEEEEEEEEEKATVFFVTNNTNANDDDDDDDDDDDALDSGFAVTCGVRVNADDKTRAVRVSYCFDVADPRVRERIESGGFHKSETQHFENPQEEEEEEEEEQKVFLVSEQRVLRPEEEMTTKMTLVEEQTGRKKEETGTMMIKVTVEVPLETLRKILERTPTRVQENVAAVLIELIEEGTRVDVLTVITKHARDTKTGALKRVFVNPFIVPRDDGAR